MSPLNCIVDDSALVASVKSNAPHSVVPWINQGAINVFVPLYALERLARLARINCPVSNDATKALRWLDQITSWTEHKIAGRVKLQGPDDQYPTWTEVEQYLLPDTPLACTDGSLRMDRLSQMLDQSMNVDALHASRNSPETSPISTASTLSSSAANGDSRGLEDETSTTLSAHGVSPQVRPLLNYTVWCTQQGAAESVSVGRFILVTNDHIIQKQASKFGVRAKLLGQLQNVLGKSVTNVSMVTQENPASSLVNGDSANDVVEEEEDEVVFDPSMRPVSSHGPSSPPNVIDPNHFGRSPKLQSRGAHSSERGAERANGGRNGRGSGRGRGNSNSNRGRGAANGAGNGAGTNSKNVPTSPAAQRGSGRSRGGANASRGTSQPFPRQIDPDSFARPSHMGRRGRGNAHKLWDPTNSG